jgi:glucose/arabinose dehydrogenase
LFVIVGVMKHFLRAPALCLVAAPLLVACTSSTPEKPDADALVPDPTAPTFCGRGADVLGVTPPDGFCVKHYAEVTEARTLVFAPNGDLFVGAPSRPSPGGSTDGPGAIVLLSDDNRDGVAEQHVFATNLVDVHGLALGDGFLYFTTQDDVWATPYKSGQRAEIVAERAKLGLPASYSMGGRWTHGLAVSKMGQLITSRGEFGICGSSMGGDVSSVAGSGTLTPIATGFRNPMYLRCHRTDEVCAATELGEDLAVGAREKLIMLRSNTLYGFPCCFTTNLVSTDSNAIGASCANVTMEDASFTLSDTPFGFDWEPGSWPAPFTNGMFVALHGSAYSTPEWAGARIVYATTDPTTHAPTEVWQDFLTGFGPDGSALDRPSDIAFSADGRMFFADDASGRVFWMAPTTLKVPN